MKVSTGFRNHLLVTGSAKAALDGKVIRMYGSPTSVAAAEALVPATADAGIGTATLLEPPAAVASSAWPHLTWMFPPSR